MTSYPHWDAKRRLLQPQALPRPGHGPFERHVTASNWVVSGMSLVKAAMVGTLCSQFSEIHFSCVMKLLRT